MTFNKGDKICVASDLCDPSTVRSFVVREVGDTWIKCEGEGNVFMRGFCFPDRVKHDLIAICTQRQLLKSQLNDSMKLVYQLCNAIARGEK